MTGFLAAAAAFIVAAVAIGLARILYGPGDDDRVMAVQLLGSGGVAALLLVAAASGRPAVVDVALVLALLAASIAAAFVNGIGRRVSAARPTSAE